MTYFNAIVDLDVPAEDGGTGDAAARGLLAALEPHLPVLEVGPRGTLVVIITLPAANLLEAVRDALEVCARAAGREPAAVHVLSTDDFDSGAWLGNTGTLSVAEAAEALGVSADVIRRRLAEGSLPGRRVGRDWRLPRSCIEQLDVPRAE